MDTSRFKHKINLAQTPFCIGMDQEKSVAYLYRNQSSDWELSEDNLRKLLEGMQGAGFRTIDFEGLKANLEAVAFEKALFCIARGTPPTQGKDGKIRCTFETRPVEKLWREDESSQIDFRNRNEINSVDEGELVAELIPPTTGVDGVGVLGQKIPAKDGRPAKLSAGQNVRFSDDGSKVYATIKGCAKIVKGRISVDNIKTIKGNVDFHTGNLKFSGDLVIQGDVKESFTVEAEGDITIMGVVDRAEVKSEANIIVEGGIYGKEGITIEAAGNISVGFAENANLRAGENIYVKNALINCESQAEEKIFFKANDKALIGGYTNAILGLEANCLGNPRLPTKTIVDFGPRPELAHRIRMLNIEFEQSEPQRRIAIREELEELREELERQSRAKVTVRGKTHPGVIFKSGKATFEARNEISSMVFYRVNGRCEILMRAYAEDKKAGK